MRASFVRKRLRGASLSTVVPAATSTDYSPELASIAATIIYKSPLPSAADLPIYILNSASFPDSKEISYDRLLPYVLARLPGEDELIGGKGYEVIFFAGGSEQRGDPDQKKNRPSITWMMQAYNVLSRAMRKRLTKLYLVHERKWVRVVTEMFSTIASPKFRRKVVHVSTLSQLALHLPIEDLLIPPSAYYRDRKIEGQIFSPYATGTRAFRVSNPLPTISDGSARLPRVLRETTSFLLAPENIKTEGLFRVNARAITLEVLKEAYDRGQKFIVWREGQFVMDFHHWKEGHGDVGVEELNEIEGYPVFAAAGLIKMWYSDLKTPMFPETTYQYLERNYSGDVELTQDKIIDLIGAESEWSQISPVHRQILRLHLLPMLSAIGQHPENKMGSKALSLCFAPSLLCGPDPIRDARMSAIVGKIVEYAVQEWTNGLQEKLGMNDNIFLDLLKQPSAPEDREDALEKDGQERPNSNESHQIQGITLIDHHNESSSDDEDFAAETGELVGPPLPPRTGSIDHSGPVSIDTSNPPRYSTIMGTVAASPITTNPSPHTVVHRKPTPAQSRKATNENMPTTNTTAGPEELLIGSMSLGHYKASDVPNSTAPPSHGQSIGLPATHDATLASPVPTLQPRSTSGIARKAVPDQKPSVQPINRTDEA